MDLTDIHCLSWFGPKRFTSIWYSVSSLVSSLLRRLEWTLLLWVCIFGYRHCRLAFPVSTYWSLVSKDWWIKGFFLEFLQLTFQSLHWVEWNLLQVSLSMLLCLGTGSCLPSLCIWTVWGIVDAVRAACDRVRWRTIVIKPWQGEDTYIMMMLFVWLFPLVVNCCVSVVCLFVVRSLWMVHTTPGYHPCWKSRRQVQPVSNKC